MRVGINTRFLIKGKLEGIGWFTWEVVRRLVERNPNWEFIFFFDRPFDSSFIPSKNVEGVVVPPPARHPLLWKIWFDYSIPFYLKKHNCDLFFSPDGYTSLRSRIPSVMVCHDLAFLHQPAGIPKNVLNYYLKHMPLYLAKAKKVITVSTFVKSDITNQYQLPDEKIDVACNGARQQFQPISSEEQRLAKAKYAKGQPYFAYLGAIHPRKNVHQLIAAFDAFKAKYHSDHKLVLGGRFAWKTGAVLSAYEKAVFKHDIHFTGYLEEKELPHLIGGAEAFVYWSLSEGFGIPVLEAMYCDVPVIVSTESSLPEVVGNAGLLVEPKDISGMVNALHLVSTDMATRINLIKNAQTQRQLFTWDHAVDVVEDAICNLNL